MFLEIIIAVAVSAALTAALLLIARNRLAKQFNDIQRRLVEVERTTHALRTGLEESTTMAQLQRLHLGLTRLHEDVAERFGPLLPLAEKMTAQGPGRDCLNGYQTAGLQALAARLGVPLEESQIGELSREVEKIETEKNLKVPLATHELLAIVIALLPLHKRSGLRVNVAGAEAQGLAAVLSGVASGFLDQVQVFTGSNEAECDVLIHNIEGFTAGGLKPGGTFISFDPASTGELPPGLELVNAEWNVRVYRKPTS